jgi:intracellular multiplication protein IcmP
MTLPWHARGLFAAFALKAARRRDEADTLLGEMARSVKSKKGMAFHPNAKLRRKILAIINDPKVGGEAAKIAKRHAYVATALLRLLEYARERGGVLAPAQFLWLRGADRALWYPLNNLGRQSFHTEAAGAIAHFQAEKAAGTPLLSPKVDNAVATIEEYTRHKHRSLVPSLVE